MEEVKEKYYWNQVQAALLSGHWNSPTPAKALKGSVLPWSELFRKAKKHSKQSDFPEAASQAYFLSVLLSETNSSGTRGQDNQSPGGALELGNECVIPEERREDAEKAYEGLQHIQSSNEYVNQIKAYFAYALDRPSECLEFISGVSFVEQLAPSHPALLVTTVDEKSKEISGPYIPSELDEKNSWTFMEALRSICLEGMAQERLSPGSPSQALASFDKGIDLLCTHSVTKSPSSRPNVDNFESFNRYAELWRWAERILWRTITLSSQYRSIEATFPALRAYSLHSVHWPPTFQHSHRSTICFLYLRALILLSPHSHLFQGKNQWMTELRRVVSESRHILGASTHFPTAGERNVLVEEFVDFCIAAWESAGSEFDQTSWVIDILWWATRLTFNSPRILRHLSRLLHIAGDNELAKRVVRLYVQVVKKARETGTMNTNGEDTHDTDATEPDTLWVQTLVQGARMLCRVPGGVKEAREAEELIKLARERVRNLSSHSIASVDLADGICKSILAIREQEPDRRGELLSRSVELLLRAVEYDPTPSACFHAALALSRPIPERDLEKAVALSRRAVEAEPKELRYWHLLALLAAKQGEWKQARGVLEAAIEMAEVSELQNQAIEENGIKVHDFAHENGKTSHMSPDPLTTTQPEDAAPKAQSSPLLIDPATKSIPQASTLFQPSLDRPLATQREQFEYALQLRMTQIAITELAEGPESVEACWLEVFEWYSQRRDIITTGSTRPSMDTRTPSPYQETQVSMQAPNEGDNGSVALATSTENSIASADAITIKSPIRSSIDRSVEAGTSDSIDASFSSSNNKEKERTSGESHVSERDTKGKRVQQMLKNQVHKQQARINTISKKIGHGVSRSSSSIHRSNSVPDLHAMLANTGPYQASSIHSRRRFSFSSKIHRPEKVRAESVAESLPPPVPPISTSMQENTKKNRSARERRLLSDLWLTSAATFRRLEKLDQTRGAIQEAECLDEENEAVWVQLGLYFVAKGDEGKAIEAFQKALFISQDDISASIHLCHLYLSSRSSLIRSSSYGALDIATGMLEALTHGPGWDVAEAWYLLSKAYGLQGRKERERNCLMFALGLSEVRGVRDVGSAIGWCL